MAQAEVKTKKVSRILDINAAVSLVGDNKYLDGVVAFKLGMLGDYTKSVVEAYVKERDKLFKEGQRKIKLINDSLKNDTSEENRARKDAEGNAINDSAQEQLNTLGEQDEDIKIPLLKLSDFIAKSDVTELVAGKDGSLESKVIIKTGQALVPVKFFTLMGDIIIDDKN